jgi:hypothetical protein
MEYTLTHRKVAVAEIEIDEETAVISRIGAVFAPEHIPIGISFKNKQPDRGDLNDWWQGRSIPASRQNIREVIKNLGVSSPGKLITRCFGLSLTDQYWANPVTNPLKWEEVNFFTNSFSEDVGNILFGGLAEGKKINLISPDNTSDGWLKKKWKIIDKKRCLVKGGSDPFWQQPFNEVMASLIMNRLKIPHVDYFVVWEDDLPYSVCGNFITPKTELVSAFYIHNLKKIKDAGMLYEHYLDCCFELGIPEARASLEKMLTVDYLIVNYDRHFNNFGAIRNAQTLKWISAAPLFDNGSSFWCNQSTANLLGNAKSQPFFATHEEQIKLVSDFTWLDFSDLSGIEEEFSELLRKSPLIDDARRDALCFALRDRTEMLMDFVNRGL